MKREGEGRKGKKMGDSGERELRKEKRRKGRNTKKGKIRKRRKLRKGKWEREDKNGGRMREA